MMTTKRVGWLVFAIVLLAGCGVLSWQAFENRKLVERSDNSGKMIHTTKYLNFVVFAVVLGLAGAIIIGVVVYKK
jgi:hypothetical protein